MNTTKQIIARLNDAHAIRAADEDGAFNAAKDDPAIKYFDGLFGKGTRSSDVNATAIEYPDVKVDDEREVTEALLQISSNLYSFECRFTTPFTKNGDMEGKVQASGDSAAKLIASFKREVKELVDAQQEDIKEDQKNLSLLKKYAK